MFPTVAPFHQYFNLDGKPLDGGYVYFGQPNQNPETAPVTMYWDAAGTQPVVQPVRTTNGYPVRSGSPVNMFSASAYSITVRNSSGQLVYYVPTSDDFNANLLLRSQLALSSGSSLVGWIQSGVGAVLRLVQDKLRDTVSVKDFGAVGNGAIVGGVLTGTNDTAAINLAIAACGKTKTLVFPDGMYIITPGGLSAIQCSVSAPGAIFIGSASSGVAPIITLDYNETYPVALGTGNTGLNAWKTFKCLQIIGNPNGDGDKSNTGIYCRNLNESQVFVDVIRGCNRGIHLDGSLLDTHQGTNDINIGHLYQCDVGFLGLGGNGGNMCESNRITGRYWFGFTTAAISLMGGGTAVRVDNVFDIVSLGVGIANGNGIMLDALCQRNIFRIRSWDSSVSGTGKLIISSGANNLFQVPALPMALVTSTGSDIFDTHSTLTDGNGRSSMSASAAPTLGTWRVGDKCWNNAPIKGNVPGWICTTAGAPGIWTEMQVLAGSPKFKAIISVAQAVTVNLDTVAVFNSATFNVGTAYNAANGVFQPAVPGYYQVSAQLNMVATTPTLVAISMLKNGVLDTELQKIGTSVSGVTIGGATLVYMNGTTDTISIRGYIAAASGASFSAGTFSAELVQST